MNANTNLIKMLGNLSLSLGPVILLVKGLAYMIGIVLIIKGVLRYKAIGQGQRSQEKTHIPMAYLIAGAALLFLPETLTTLANTAFGVGNVLQYTQSNSLSIDSTITTFVRLVGLVWFIHGCLLLAHASQPGMHEGVKGVVFLLSGIAAINLENTVGVVTYAMNGLIDLTRSARGLLGG